MKMVMMMKVMLALMMSKLKGKFQYRNLFEIPWPKVHRNQTRMEKTQNHQYQDQKVKTLSKKQEKTPKTWEGPSFVEDIKVKMQASVDKEGILLKAEAKFISYVNNCIQMTYQEAI